MLFFVMSSHQAVETQKRKQKLPLTLETKKYPTNIHQNEKRKLSLSRNHEAFDPQKKNTRTLQNQERTHKYYPERKHQLTSILQHKKKKTLTMVAIVFFLILLIRLVDTRLCQLTFALYI